MGFRIHDVKFFDNDELLTDTITLSKSSRVDDENYYSVIIGNNGTGKSRLLSKIIDSYREIGEGKKRSFFSFDVNYTFGEKNITLNRVKGERLYFEEVGCVPEKIIAITNSITDKFPTDNFYRSQRLDNDEPSKKQYYVYLGNRNAANLTSSSALIGKVIDLMLEHMDDNEILHDYATIFDYLNYKPLLKLKYVVRMNEDYIKKYNNDVKQILESKKQEDDGFYKGFVNKVLENFSSKDFDEITKFYRDLVGWDRKDFIITIDFRRQKEDLNYSIREKYYYINTLQRLGLVGGAKVILSNKNGHDFIFSKASSGEANILSTLIGLIPSLKDNSLILIDEPEISLHPLWQFKYIELLDRILRKRKGCHVIIATHSHFIISDLPIGRSTIISLKTEDQFFISSEIIDDETHGSSAEDILLNVFGLPSTRNYYLSNLVTKGLELVARGDRKSLEYNKIIIKLQEITPLLKGDDPLKEIINTMIELED